MKCGSFLEALKMIKIAKEFKLKIMLGCMVESSVAITAVSQIAKLADKLDLDGNLLIKNDPYHGVWIKEGHLLLPDRPGLGLSLKKNILDYSRDENFRFWSHRYWIKILIWYRFLGL